VKDLNFTGDDYTKTSEFIEDLMDVGKYTNVIFTAEVEVEGFPKKNIDILLNNRIKMGWKKTFKLELQRCGAYMKLKEMDKKDWTQFMCHNLGADTSLDPFTPSENIHGDKYQWGHSTPSVLQRDDKYTGYFPNWENQSKIYKDPCPAGYVAMADVYLRSVLNINTLTRIGSWTSPTGKKADAGFKIGENLFFPAVGVVGKDGNANPNITPNSALACYWMWFNEENSNPCFLEVNDKKEIFHNGTRDIIAATMPVRCSKIYPIY